MNKLDDMLKFRYVVFDFDNTLAGHTAYAMEYSEYKAEMVRYLQGKVTFNDVEVNEHLKKCMDFLSEHNVPMGLCSAISDNPVALMAEAKAQWVKENYGHNLRNLCVSEAPAKSMMLEILHETFGCNAEDILMVDDSYDVLEDCASKGFSICTPMHIVNLISKEETKDEM